MGRACTRLLPVHLRDSVYRIEFTFCRNSGWGRRARCFRRASCVSVKRCSTQAHCPRVFAGVIGPRARPCGSRCSKPLELLRCTVASRWLSSSFLSTVCDAALSHPRGPRAAPSRSRPTPNAVHAQCRVVLHLLIDFRVSRGRIALGGERDAPRVPHGSFAIVRGLDCARRARW